MPLRIITPISLNISLSLPKASIIAVTRFLIAATILVDCFRIISAKPLMKLTKVSKRALITVNCESENALRNATIISVTTATTSRMLSRSFANTARSISRAA